MQTGSGPISLSGVPDIEAKVLLKYIEWDEQDDDRPPLPPAHLPREEGHADSVALNALDCIEREVELTVAAWQPCSFENTNSVVDEVEIHGVAVDTFSVEFSKVGIFYCHCISVKLYASTRNHLGIEVISIDHFI